MQILYRGINTLRWSDRRLSLAQERSAIYVPDSRTRLFQNTGVTSRSLMDFPVTEFRQSMRIKAACAGRIPNSNNSNRAVPLLARRRARNFVSSSEKRMFLSWYEGITALRFVPRSGSFYINFFHSNRADAEKLGAIAE